jgi:hypothetical protein
MSEMRSLRRHARPGDVMLHPVVVTAICVLLANDHMLKQRFPGAITGILSDIAGLAFFPLALVATVELLSRRVMGTRSVVVLVALTGLVFACAELVPAGRIALEVVWGWSRTMIGGGRPVVFTADPTDLLALPALAVAWAIGGRRASFATPRQPEA